MKLQVGKTYVCNTSCLEVTVLNNPYGNKYKLRIVTPYRYMEVKYYELNMKNIKHWKEVCHQ